MIFTANYAMTRYAASIYGVRGPAGYISNTSDAVTGNDGLAAAAGCNTATSDSITGEENLTTLAASISATADGISAIDSISVSAGIILPFAEDVTGADLISIVAGFFVACQGGVTAFDASLSQFFRPVNVLTLPVEKRAAVLLDEVREALAFTRTQGIARRENRQRASTDNRNVSIKSDGRDFEV